MEHIIELQNRAELLDNSAKLLAGQFLESTLQGPVTPEHELMITWIAVETANYHQQYPNGSAYLTLQSYLCVRKNNKVYFIFS
jgi:predicted transcriptional regulator